MNYFLAIIVFLFCFGAMAIGLILAKKVLTKGCSIDPDACKCRKEGKDPSECDN
ncbi:hypothetical protein MNBD_BACTEROID05-304 [hydrothermal vent metagenome]|uniref:Uncharacterized protein n=1 Tax=hydrothermal vent metagenome TaxID=652676 RepID=A0A3B0UEZ6_9ZZZZ